MRRPRDRFSADARRSASSAEYDLAVLGLWIGPAPRPRLQRLSLSDRRAPRLLPARRRPLDLSRLPVRGLRPRRERPRRPLRVGLGLRRARPHGPHGPAPGPLSRGPAIEKRTAPGRQ
ncbi:MAG: hypothetical protein MZW92_62065 [Comamonadaceae bacterium]|nr:hypothetical protein [Comamonadaceae bacterium]